MAYVEDRIIHDADAHTMEPPEWLEPFASAEVIRYARRPLLHRRQRKGARRHREGPLSPGRP